MGWNEDTGYTDWLLDVPKCTVKVLKFIYNYGYKEEYVCVCEGN